MQCKRIRRLRINGKICTFFGVLQSVEVRNYPSVKFAGEKIDMRKKNCRQLQHRVAAVFPWGVRDDDSAETPCVWKRRYVRRYYYVKRDARRLRVAAYARHSPPRGSRFANKINIMTTPRDRFVLRRLFLRRRYNPRARGGLFIHFPLVCVI